jgi:GDP-4-dehydro-6-deoxy-D-mannose reductase
LRVLITGASGFAGGWLARACVESGDEVVGVSRRGASGRDLSRRGASRGGASRRGASGCEGVERRALDLRDGDGVRALLREVRPDVVYHLAALSHVGRSWEDPADTVVSNVSGAVNVLEGVRSAASEARVVWVSTCEVYGPSAALPIGEDEPLNPANPYAVSKTAGDQLAGVYADAHGLDLVRARPFNHTGPGQMPIFIVSSLARQAAEGRTAGVSELTIVTGNPDTRRDFTDVRDVVRAYRSLAALAGPGAGRAFNVSSGRSVSAADHVALLGELVAPIRVVHEVDPVRVRAHEVMDLRGDFGRLRAATGWEPSIPLRQTIADMIEWWERELTATATRSPPGRA